MKNLQFFISRHLLLLVTLCFMSGIVIARATLTVVIQQKWTTALLGGMLLLLFFFYRSKKQFQILLLLPLLFMVSGFHHARADLSLPRNPLHIFHQIHQRQEIVLVGTLLKMVEYDGVFSRALIDTELLKKKSQGKWQTVRGRVRLTMKGVWPDKIRPGDTLVVRATVRQPSNYNTPGAFNYREFLAAKNIWITGSIRSPLLIQKVATEQSLFHKIRFYGENARVKIGNFLDATFEQKELSALYRAILIGNRSGIPNDILEQFRASGTFHILAISGLHVGIIATLLYFFILRALLFSSTITLHFSPHKIAALICVPIMICYAQLAGMQIPVIRAIIMGTIVLIAVCTDRSNSSSPLLAAAALLILFFQPMQLFSASFKLSFAAVAAILFFLPKAQQYPKKNINDISRRMRIWRTLLYYFVSGILISTIALLATGPISLSIFHRYSLLSPVSNLLVEPLICLLSLPVGLFSLLLLGVAPDIAASLLHFGALALKLSLFLTNLLSSWSPSFTWGPSPSPLSLTLYFLLFVLFAVLRYHGSAIGRAGPVFLLLAFFFFFPIYGKPTNSQASLSRLDYLDVGQGSATLVTLAGGMKILIDGGGSQGAKVGRRVIAPFLWSRNIRHIDAIVLTHPDGDHCNGLPFIIEHFSPTFIWTVSRKSQGKSRTYKQVLESSKEFGTTVISPQAGDRFGRTDSFLECLDRTDQNLFEYGSRRNSGLVVKVCDQGTCSLFPGDIERDDETMLLERHLDLRAAVLLAPHHGSKTSVYKPFLDAVQPQTIVVSAAKNRKKYFPTPALVTYCTMQDIPLLTTASNGTIIIHPETGVLQIQSYLNRSPNPFLPTELSTTLLPLRNIQPTPILQ